MEDANFNSIFQLPSNKSAAGAANVPPNKVYLEESIDSITAMGFTRPQAIKALDSTNGDVVKKIFFLI